MKGCRPLSDLEINAILGVLSENRAFLRDKCLFLVGIKTGFRISELLSLKVSDAFQNGNIVSGIYVAKCHMKKKLEGRKVPLHPQAREALTRLIEDLKARSLGAPETFLFLSRKGKNMALDKKGAWLMLKKAYAKCGLTGKLATHSMRKSFAVRVHEALGSDIFKTQKAMGHKDPASTAAYLSVSQDEIDAAILKS